MFTDDATIQCVAVRVTSDSPGSPDEELCFSLSLSATTTVSGLTLSPAVATVCVVPTEGECMYVNRSVFVRRKCYAVLCIELTEEVLDKSIAVFKSKSLFVDVQISH